MSTFLKSLIFESPHAVAQLQGEQAGLYLAQVKADLNSLPGRIRNADENERALLLDILGTLTLEPGEIGKHAQKIWRDLHSRPGGFPHYRKQMRASVE